MRIFCRSPTKGKGFARVTWLDYEPGKGARPWQKCKANYLDNPQKHNPKCNVLLIVDNLINSEIRISGFERTDGSNGTRAKVTGVKPVHLDADRQRMAIIFPRGEAIRNFAYAGTLDRVNEEFGVHVLTVDPGLDFETLLLPKCDRLIPLVECDDRWIVRIQRELLETAHNRWLWSRAAKERSRLRDREAQTLRQKAVRRTKKIVSFPFANRHGLKMLTKIERTSSQLFRTTNAFLDLYREIGPALVFNASHVHSHNATQAVQAAQWLGIPTATFIFSWDNLTSQGRIILPYDYFLVWNETLKQQLLEMYDWIKPENVYVTGTPQFDLHFREETYLGREEYCEMVGADPLRPIVLYTTGMANHMPGEPEIVEGIADILAAYPPETRPQLLVRVYAKDLTGRFDDLRTRRPDILFADPLWEPAWLTPKPEDSIALVNALRHCSLGINVASTVSLELCMFDKPVINVGYNPPSVPPDELSYADYYEFDHYKPVVDSGAVQVAGDIEQMGGLIRESLSLPEKHNKQREELIDQMFGETLDGRSGSRVAETLINIARACSDE